MHDWYKGNLYKLLLVQVMAISTILIPSVSFKESVGTPSRRVRWFGRIPTTVPTTTPITDPHVFHNDTSLIPDETPTISPITSTIPPTTPTTLYTSPFNHMTYMTMTHLIHYHHPLMRYHLLVGFYLHHLVKKVWPLHTYRLVVRHSVDYSSSNHFTSDDSSRDLPSDSSSVTSLDSSSDALSDSSPSHSSPALPSGMRSSHQLCSLLPSIPYSPAAITERPSHSSSAGSPRKRNKSYESYVPRETSSRVDVDVRGSDEPHSEPILTLRSRRVQGVWLRLEMIELRILSDDIPEPTHERAVRVTYEMLGDLGHRIVATATMTREVVNELINHRVAEALETRDAARNLEPLVEGRGEQEDVKTDDPNITMEEYIRLEEEKARRRAIVFNDTLTSEAPLSCEPTVSSLNDEIDFRILFDESKDEDYTVVFDKNRFPIN
nr:hypothetical protein [Tanacetum cinerariifolium]